MSARGPGNEKRPAGQSNARRRGEVEVKVTVDELVAAAINVTQNGWPLEALGYGWTRNPNEGIRVMLGEIYEAILAANQRAASKRLAKRGRSPGSPAPSEPTYPRRQHCAPGRGCGCRPRS